MTISPDTKAWRRFVRAVRRRGMGRVEVDVELRVGSEPVLTSRSAFVALSEATG